MSNWNEEKVAQLEAIVGAERPVTQETVKAAAEELGVSTRSVAAKLRNMEYEVEKVGEKEKTFSEAQEVALREFLEDNAGEFTYAEVAERFEDGAFNPRQIQGKVLSMELTENVKPTPKMATPRSYTEEEESTIVRMAKAGAFLEDIAEAVGKTLNSVRGKALSLLRNELLDKIPSQKQSYASRKDDPFEGLDLAEMSVAEIAEATGKSERGVKTMITHRGLTCADYKAKPRKKDKEAA